MDSKGQLLVAGTSENAVHVMDLANPMAWKDTVGGLMHYQIRAVTCLSGGVGYAVAGTDGRCAFRWLDQEKQRFDTHLCNTRLWLQRSIPGLRGRLLS